MFGLQSTLIIFFLGAGSTLFFYVKTVKLEADIEKMNTKLQASEQLSTTLQASLDQQNILIQKFESFQKAENEKLEQLIKEKEEADERTAEVQHEIAKLRSKEKSWALHDPFMSGNRATDRLNNSLQRIARTNDNNR